MWATTKFQVQYIVAVPFKKENMVSIQNFTQNLILTTKITTHNTSNYKLFEKTQK